MDVYVVQLSKIIILLSNVLKREELILAIEYLIK